MPSYTPSQYLNAGGGTGPYNFTTGPSTLDPGSMNFLTAFLGGSNSPYGPQLSQQINGYDNYYSGLYGNQAPGGPNSYYQQGGSPYQAPANRSPSYAPPSNVAPKPSDESGNPDQNGGGTNGSGTNGTNSGATPPYMQEHAVSDATARNLGRQWQDPQFLQSYGNYGPQYPNQSTQIGASMYSNIMPQPYTPSWALQPPQMPNRLQGNGYLNGGPLNYGLNSRAPGSNMAGNPYPLDPRYNPYSTATGPANMNVPVTPGYISGNYNPFLNNQQGGQPYGLPRPAAQQQNNAMQGGLFGQYKAQASPPSYGGMQQSYGYNQQQNPMGYANGMGMSSRPQNFNPSGAGGNYYQQPQQSYDGYQQPAYGGQNSGMQAQSSQSYPQTQPQQPQQPATSQMTPDQTAQQPAASAPQSGLYSTDPNWAQFSDGQAVGNNLTSTTDQQQPAPVTYYQNPYLRPGMQAQARDVTQQWIGGNPPYINGGKFNVGSQTPGIVPNTSY